MAVNIKDSLTTKIGPLPIGVWVGVPAIGYITYKWWRHKPTGGAADSGTPVAEYVGDVGEADDFSDGFSNAYGDYYTGGQSSTASNVYTPPAIANNQEWGRQAVNFLIAAGISPAKAKRVINAFLYGTQDTLNTEETAILNMALTQYKDPPEPITQMPGTTEPTPEVPPPVYNPPTGPPVTATVKPTFHIVIRDPQGRVRVDQYVHTTAEIERIRKPYDEVNQRLASGQDWGEGGPYTITLNEGP